MINLIRLPLFFALLVSLGLPTAYLPQAEAAPRKPKKAAEPAECNSELTSAASAASAVSRDDSEHAGILMHGEHWVDLILAASASEGTRQLEAFTEITQTLTTALQGGVLKRVNEKIDGSPSVVAGYDRDGAPFVAYKGQFSRKTKQVILKSAEDVRTQFAKKEALQNVFLNLLAHLETAMRESSKQFESYIFQGDLLFVEGDGRKSVPTEAEPAVSIRANAITYTLSPEHVYFKDVNQAKIAVVFHTVGERGLEDPERLTVGPLTTRVDPDSVLEQFVAAIDVTPGLFAITPFKDGVKVGASSPMTAETKAKVDSALAEIGERLGSLSATFKKTWGSKFEAKWRVFFNSGLRPPNNGGIYRSVADGTITAPRRLRDDFKTWLSTRESKDKELDAALAEQFATFEKKNGTAINHVLESYQLAIKIQYLLQPSLEEAFRSKLGGGDSEGLMVKTSSTIVKLVDRLRFTMLNNSRWNRFGGLTPAAQNGEKPTFEGFPAPFQSWQSDALFVVMKGQPPHAGHVKMIQEALRLKPGAAVYVLLSHKSPNLEATEWKKLGIASTKKELAAKKYTYLFSSELRSRLLTEALSSEKYPPQVVVVDPGYFWKYLEVAKSLQASGELTGKVGLVMGDKEVTEGRYGQQLVHYAEILEAVAIPAQEGGISATQVRDNLRLAVLGTAAEKKSARLFLDQALSYVPKKAARTALIKELLAEWQAADDAVERLFHP